MATKQFNARIQHKIDTYDNWKKATNFIPLKGEIIIYTTDEEGNEILSIKIGDGETGVNNLQNLGGSADYVAGNLIEIKDNIISSTLGTKNVSTKEVEFCNIESIPSDCYGDGQTVYSGECDCVPALDDKVNVEITLANSDVPIYFNDVTVKSYQYDTVCILTNSDQTIEDFDSNGIIKKDENLPAVFCMWFEEDGVCYYTLISFEDITGASIKVDGIATKTEVIKLPNEALTFDSEPTENSINLVNSGDLYNVIGDINTVVAQINTLIGGGSQ